MQNRKRSRLHYFSWFKGPFKVWPIFLGVHCLISSILKNWLMEIKALGPNLHVSAIKSTIEGCAGSPYHDHQISWLCLSTTVCTWSLPSSPPNVTPHIKPAYLKENKIKIVGWPLTLSCEGAQWYVLHRDECESAQNVKQGSSALGKTLKHLTLTH